LGFRCGNLGVEECFLDLPVVDRMPKEVARRERAKRFFESEPLAVSFAFSLGLDAVATSRLAFITLDAASTTS
jgi:hypothetical protein